VPGGGPPGLVSDLAVACDGREGFCSALRVDVGELLGGGPAHFVPDLAVARDGQACRGGAARVEVRELRGGGPAMRVNPELTRR
jgi:hypothetical protein